MPNLLSGQVFSSAPAQVAVNSTSGAILASNTDRMGVALVNLSTGTIYLSFGLNAAVLGSGIALLPSGGTWSMDDYTFTKEAVNGIAHVDASALAVQEFYVKF